MLHTSLMESTNAGFLPDFSKDENSGKLTMAWYNFRALVESLWQPKSPSLQHGPHQMLLKQCAVFVFVFVLPNS